MNMNIPLPRLLDGKTRAFKQTINPVEVSVELNIVPLSTATIQMPHGETIPARDYVEIFTSIGSVGIFRARNPEESFEEYVSEIELESAIVEIGDYLVKAKYDQMMDVGTAITTIFSHYGGTFWAVDTNSLSVFANERQVSVSCEYVNVLEALLSIMEQIPSYMITMDYSSTTWLIGFAKRDTVASAEGRLTRNMNSVTIGYDDSEMCTRAYYDFNDTDPKPHMDADTISTYGVIERLVSTGSDYTQQEAEFAVSEYLRKHKIPKISIDISADDLSKVTGENLDTFRLGKLFRLEMPSYGISRATNTGIEKTIMQISWDDVYGAPRLVNLHLEDEEDAVINYIHGE